MDILLIDNYDSFTYNLVHYLQGLGCRVDVIRNDSIDFNEVKKYDKIVLSPGPGLPSEANQMPELIKQYIDKKPILGVCLGHQAIVEHFKGELFNQTEVKHGIQENCKVDVKSRLFSGLPEVITVGLYHSWAAKSSVLPLCLAPTAISENNVIMAIEHIDLPVCGVQFHPESIMTECGKEIVENFLKNF